MMHSLIRSKTGFLGTLFGLMSLSLPAIAQEKSADELAQELANPNSPLASLNFKNQFRFFGGSLPNAGDQSSYTMLFQPGFPFALKNGDQLIWRPAVPFIIDQPVYDPATLDFRSESGLGDIGFDLAYARTSDSGILTAFGVFTTLPTASSSLLGAGKWSIGPEILIGKITEDYVLGVFPNHQWDITGWGDGSVNLTSMQVFATYLPGGGWNVGTSPTFSYDWHRDQWTVPFNLTVGKTVLLGGKPWKISAEVNYYVEKPSYFGAEWMVGINITPVVKNVLADWFK